MTVLNSSFSLIPVRCLDITIQLAVALDRIQFDSLQGCPLRLPASTMIMTGNQAGSRIRDMGCQYVHD